MSSRNDHSDRTWKSSPKNQGLRLSRPSFQLQHFLVLLALLISIYVLKAGTANENVEVTEGLESNFLIRIGINSLLQIITIVTGTVNWGTLALKVLPTCSTDAPCSTLHDSHRFGLQLSYSYNSCETSKCSEGSLPKYCYSESSFLQFSPYSFHHHGIIASELQ